jgi:probable phosphoglycerate mutase
VHRVFLFRHGETHWNREGRFQGHLDIPINETGRGQARMLIDPLRKAGLEAILSSDLSRAYETARIVANSLAIPVFVHPGLREAHLGEAQGLVKEEIEAKFGSALLHRWRSDRLTDADVAYPGGESGTAIISRVFESMEAFLKQSPYQRVGIATHGGVIRRIMSKLLPPGSPPVAIPNGVLYEVNYQRSENLWEKV